MENENREIKRKKETGRKEARKDMMRRKTTVPCKQ